MKLKDILAMDKPVYARRPDPAPHCSIEILPEDIDADSWEYSIDGVDWFDGNLRVEYLKPVDGTGRAALDIPGSGCRVLDSKENPDEGA